MKTPFEILARRAFAKVRLDSVRLNTTASTEEFLAVMKEFRQADREQRKLNSEYADNHEALALAEQKIQGQLL